MDEEFPSQTQLAEEQDEQLPVFLEIQSKEQLVHLQWSHPKNLLGILLSTGAFQLFRASFKANKIKEITASDGDTLCTAFAFSPQCDWIAISNSEGEIRGSIVCKIGDNHTDISRKPSKNSIKLLRWLPLLGDNPSSQQPNPLQKNSVSDKFLPQIEAHKLSKEDNITKMNLLHAKNTESSSLLYCLDAEDKMALLLDGQFQIAVISVDELLSRCDSALFTPVDSTEETALVHDMFVDYNNARVALLHSANVLRKGTPQKSMFLSTLDFTYVNSSYNTVVPITVCIGALEELAKNISHTVDSLAATCRAIADLHNQKGFFLEEWLNKDDRTKGFAPYRDFARNVRTGEQSVGLIKMLTGTLLPNEIVQAHGKISNHFNYLVEVLTDSLQSALERSLVVAESLAAEFSKDPLCSGLTGLRSRAISRLDSRIQNFLNKSEEYLAVVGQTKRQTSAFSAWLYQLAKRLEERREDSPEANEVKPEELELQNINPSKSDLLALFDTEESFMLAGLGGYVKTMKLPPVCSSLFETKQTQKEQPYQKQSVPSGSSLDQIRDRALQDASNRIKFFLQKTTGRPFSTTEPAAGGMDIEQSGSTQGQTSILNPIDTFLKYPILLFF